MPDDRYPPGEWTEEELAELLGSVDGSMPLPSYEDEETWSRLSSHPRTGPVVEKLLTRAESARSEPIPSLPASGFLDYHRQEGGTFRTKDRWMQRRKRLSLFALAECFDRTGRYLDAILDYAWAMCEETTWLVPGHLPDAQNCEGLPRSVPASERGLALFSARAGQLLMELDHVLGGQLHPALRARIREEVRRRVLEPYLAREDLHWEGVPGVNWNPVCTASTVIAAIHLESDPTRLAPIIHRGIHSVGRYLEGFDADGCAGEGISYWNFGMSHYAMLGAHIAARTNGQVSLLSPPALREIALFPLRVQLSPGRYVAFSDADEAAWIEPFVACWLGDGLDLPGMTGLGVDAFGQRQSLFAAEKVGTLSELLRNLVWCRRASASDDPPVPSRRNYFGGTEWWLARAAPADVDGLVVATKGGHNGEPHNHNDCGSFVIHYHGESLLTDLGRAAYDNDYFGERRYEHLVTRSLGHSVPYVDGCEQPAGPDYAASVLDRTHSEAVDDITLELAACYPAEAGVSSLIRRVRLDREPSPPSVSISDELTFDGEAAERSFASVLVSYFPMQSNGDEVTVTGERGRARIAFEPAASVTVEQLEDAVEPADSSESGPRDVWRARLTPDRGADPSRRSLRMRCDLGPVDG